MKMNIVGAGRVGIVLGSAFHQKGLVEIGTILNKTHESAKLASSKIGSGRSISHKEQLEFAEVWMLAVSDDAIGSLVSRLKGTDFSRSIVFHCSGALPSTVLKPLNAKGVASVHPVMTFASGKIENLNDTFFTLEGDADALQILSPLAAPFKAFIKFQTTEMAQGKNRGNGPTNYTEIAVQSVDSSPQN